ncbi:hypothetical protein [Streptomyces sp. NPDC017448]|uniref:hypothetical protein n=1 Tax=Streptomyces sp. NPDC017448 TaxID=3364996 RepID=UPI0037BCB743
MTQSFRSAGVFEKYDDATALIKVLPKILAELGLQERFKVNWAPKAVTERRVRGRARAYFDVLILDERPNDPPPSITSEDIARARERVEQRERDESAKQSSALSFVEAAEQKESQLPNLYTAFGQSKTISAWAQLFQTSTATVWKYWELHDDLETALSQIAVKKHNAA